MNLPTDRILGLLLGLGGAALILLSGLLAWNGWKAWSAVSAMDGVQARWFNGDLAGARTLGREALECAPDSGAAGLASLDLENATAAAQLQEILGRCRGADRDAVASAAALVAAERGEPLPACPAGDAELAAYIASKGSAAWPTLGTGAVPSSTLLYRALALRLRTAWSAGRGEEIRASASALALLAPRHPQAPELRLIAACFDPIAATRGNLNGIENRISDQQRRTTLATWMLPFAPAANTAAISLVARSGADDPAAALRLRLDAEARSAEGTAAPDATILRCLLAQYDPLADRLIARLPADRKAVFTPLRSSAEQPAAGDALRIAGPWTRGGLIACQLGSGAGVPTRAVVTIAIDGREVPADHIRRWGTLVWAECDKSGAADVVIRLAGKPLFSSRLTF